MKHIFRAYDIRGVFNRELSTDVVSRIGLAFGTYLGGKGKVFVGRDVRTSSEIIENAFVSALASTGVDVFSSGLIPTPTSNFKTFKGDFDAGAYITASHNPPEYNGIRFRHPDGTGYTVQNEEIRDIFLKGKYHLAGWDKLGSITKIDPKETIREYSEFLLEHFDFGRRIKVTIDPGNGAASLVAPGLFKKLGSEVSTINAELDGTFPGRPSEPNEKNLYGLRKAVVDNGSEFGAGYDGDGDRVVFVDNQGRAVQTEKIGIIISREILKEKKGIIIANVECSMIVEKEIEKAGGEIKRVRVGDVFVAEKIKEHRALFGMETSAHYFTPKFYGFDDPIIVSLMLGEILSKGGSSLAEMSDEIPSYPKTMKNYSCPDEIKFEVMKKIIESFKDKGYELDLTDGARVIFDYGWALIRPSNTTPLIRASVEAETDEKLGELLSMVGGEFRAALEDTK
ncbi:MAG: phosphoglucosamine mutase [Candidatus Hydrothermarchaeaceae archaeon]